MGGRCIGIGRFVVLVLVLVLEMVRGTGHGVGFYLALAVLLAVLLSLALGRGFGRGDRWLYHRDKAVVRDALVYGYHYRQIHGYAGRDSVPV